jgi:serine/threonine protein kinase
MDYVNGYNMIEILSRIPMPINGIKYRPSEWHLTKLVRDLVVTIKRLHSAGIAHRDIKPENIMVVEAPDD